MRPRIICHMIASADGKTDGLALEAVLGRGEYEAVAATLSGDAWMCGRTTMERHFAADTPFVSAANEPAGPQPVFVARRAPSYAVAVDTFGKLDWMNADIQGDHLVCLVSERAPTDYLAMLRAKEISYLVAGADAVDLARAVEGLGEHFGVRTLLLEGGGHVNGGFLAAGLVDELSLLLAPAIDGRRGVSAVFDGMIPPGDRAVSLKLRSVEHRPKDILWLRYDVARP